MITTMFVRIGRTVAEWRRRSRARQELLDLSASDLHDFRWNKMEARVEASKWFWQA